MNPFRLLGQQKQVFARDYLRVSKSRNGRSRSPEEQHGDHMEDCTELGWTLAESYTDRVSASRYSRKRRDEFLDMLADLEHDRFGAQVLMLWEGSRGSRQIEEWVALVNLCEQRGVFIWVHIHQRLYDLSNYRDRKDLLEDALESEAESAKTSHRTKRNSSASAALGRPHGPAPFGYQRRYDPRTRELIAQEIVPAEAELVRELYAALLAGKSMRSVASDWETRGVRTRSGRVWSQQNLRAMMLSPTYAGLRGHSPGRGGGTTPALKSSQLVQGIWEGIISRDDWYAAQNILRNPERSKSRPGRGIHLSSMIARCGVCTGPMSVGYRGERVEYACSDRGCVRINKADLDEHLEAVLLDYLAQDEVIEQLRVSDAADSEELTRLKDSLAEVQTEYRELGEDVGAGRLTRELAAMAEPGIRARIEKLEKTIKELDVPRPLRGLIAPGADVAVRWKDAPMSTRRQTMRAMFSPERLGVIQVVRSPRRGNVRVPASERVSFWRPEPSTEQAA